MPSPLGHAIGAVAVGWAVANIPRGRTQQVRQVAVLAALGMAPDLDLLIGRHRAEMHSIGAALIMATVALWGRWPIGASGARLWLAACAAWGSHVLLDALGADSSPPGGLMAFWPVSTEFYQAPWDVFANISRRWWTPQFYLHNAIAVLREVVILAPVAALVYWRRTRSQHPQLRD
jgi:hypothetical protein